MPAATPATVDELLGAAHAAFAAGRLGEARGALEQALALCAGDRDKATEVAGDLAVVAASDARLDEALALAQQVLGVDPTHAAAREVVNHCTEAQAHLAAAQQLSGELQAGRVAQFSALSTCLRVTGDPVRHQAVQLIGAGRMVFGTNIQFGWATSPGFYSGYAYVEARNRETLIDIGDNVVFNNNPVLIGEGPGITIGADTLFGPGVQILDTDAHDLHPARRHGGRIATAQVTIGRNVFVGSSVIITKGVTIGENTVVGAGSVVVKSLPADVIAAGNPARPLRPLDAESSKPRHPCS